MIGLPLSNTRVSLLALLVIGFSVGVCAGCLGVGGAFIVTPALNILGLPMAYAIGTGLADVLGKSLVATIRHATLHHIDFTLGLLMAVGVLPGVEMGKRIILRLERSGQAGSIVHWLYMVLLFSLGTAMVRESLQMREVKETGQGDGSPMSARVQALPLPPRVALNVARIPGISIWVVLLIGLGTGLVSGLLGAGGGFVLTPMLLYVVGCPTVVAVGTGLLTVLFSGAYGTLAYALAGRVEFVAALVMLTGSMVGAQLGATATCHVQERHIRLYFGLSILLTGVSVLLKELSTRLSLPQLSTWAAGLLIGTTSLLASLILYALARAIRRRDSSRAVRQE
jgi:uncharacterized membrane protein YfcA